MILQRLMEENWMFRSYYNRYDEFGEYFKRNALIISKIYEKFEYMIKFLGTKDDYLQEIMVVVSDYYNKGFDNEYLERKLNDKMVDLYRYFTADKRNMKVDYVEKVEEEEIVEYEGEINMDIVKILTEEERNIFIMYAVFDYNFNEIGAKIGCTRQTAAKRYKAIQRKLQETLGGLTI